MRRLLISTLVSLALGTPALAQDAPHDKPATANPAEGHNDTLTDAMQSIQRTIQMRLALAGFTDIQMVPTSFLISAKDRDGHTVTLMASPNSITELQEAGPGTGEQDENSGNDIPSGQAPATDRSLNRDL